MGKESYIKDFMKSVGKFGSDDYGIFTILIPIFSLIVGGVLIIAPFVLIVGLIIGEVNTHILFGCWFGYVVFIYSVYVVANEIIWLGRHIF